MGNLNTHTMSQAPKMSQTAKMSQAPNEIGCAPDLIAIGLLRLRQRLDALDRLYNEDISTLHQVLAELTADYVRLCEAWSSLPRRGKLPGG